MKVIITGSSGLIGSRILKLLQGDFDFIPLSHTAVDIVDKEAVSSYLQSADYQLLLHMAAYTDVDKAETDREACRRVNVEGTRNLFETCSQMGKMFAYVSTGFVFDGENPPYDESSRPHPLSYYGQTKFEAEKIVGNKGMVVRIEYPYGAVTAKKMDFAGKIADLLKQGKRLTMVDDSLMTPTFIDDIAAGLKHLMADFSPEIFHLVGGDSLSPFQAAHLIARKIKADPGLIEPVGYEEYYRGKAPRPRKGAIISVKNNFVKMRRFEDGINAGAMLI